MCCCSAIRVMVCANVWCGEAKAPTSLLLQALGGNPEPVASCKSRESFGRVRNECEQVLKTCGRESRKSLVQVEDVFDVAMRRYRSVSNCSRLDPWRNTFSDGRGLNFVPVCN